MGVLQLFFLTICRIYKKDERKLLEIEGGLWYDVGNGIRNGD
jgi:hypothetical protein